METLTIKAFKDKYKISFTIEAIAYHMKKNKVDWSQPGRDKFIILTDKTKNFYNI